MLFNLTKLASLHNIQHLYEQQCKQQSQNRLDSGDCWFINSSLELKCTFMRQFRWGLLRVNHHLPHWGQLSALSWGDEKQTSRIWSIRVLIYMTTSTGLKHKQKVSSSKKKRKETLFSVVLTSFNTVKTNRLQEMKIPREWWYMVRVKHKELHRFGIHPQFSYKGSLFSYTHTPSC